MVSANPCAVLCRSLSGRRPFEGKKENLMSSYRSSFYFWPQGFNPLRWLRYLYNVAEVIHTADILALRAYGLYRYTFRPP